MAGVGGGSCHLQERAPWFSWAVSGGQHIAVVTIRKPFQNNVWSKIGDHLYFFTFFWGLPGLGLPCPASFHLDVSQGWTPNVWRCRITSATWRMKNGSGHGKPTWWVNQQMGNQNDWMMGVILYCLDWRHNIFQRGWNHQAVWIYNRKSNHQPDDYLFLEVNLHHLSLGHQNEEGLVKSSLSKG